MLHPFRQTIAGVPVEGRTLTVRTDAAATVRWVSGALENPPSASDATPTLTPADARLQASNLLQRTLPDDADTTLVFRPFERQPRLVYRVDAPLDLTTMESPTVWIDAQTGELRGRTDRTRFASADIYAVNPVTTPELSPVTLDPLVPGTPQRLVGSRVQAMNCLDQGKTTGGLAICTPQSVAQADGAGNFTSYLPVTDQSSAAANSDPFAEIQAYYHVNKVFSYFAGLGFAGTALSPFPAIVNFRLGTSRGGPLQPYDNAFYTPSGRSIFGSGYSDLIILGQGTSVDFSYDGDVIYHEITHSVVGATSELVSSTFQNSHLLTDPGAMNEGFADYFSSVIRNDPVLGRYSLGNQARDLSQFAGCPNDLHGEVHLDSSVWSSSLWEIRQTLGTPFDLIVYATMTTLSSDATFAEATTATLREVETQLGADALAQATAVFAHHGLPDCAGYTFPLAAPSTTLSTIMLPDSSTGFSPTPSPIAYRVDHADQLASLSLSLGAITQGNSSAPPQPELILAVDQPFQLTSSGGRLSGWSNEIPVATGNSTYPIPIPAGAHTLYLMFMNAGSAGRIANATFFLTYKEGYDPDAGGLDPTDTGDAGAVSDTGILSDTGDVGYEPGVDVGTDAGAPIPVRSHSGCSSVGGLETSLPALSALLLAVGLRRRRRA